MAELQERGCLNNAGMLTDEGLAARTRIEDETDDLALGPWLGLGQERTHRFCIILNDLLRVILEQNGLPGLRTPIGLS